MTDIRLPDPLQAQTIEMIGRIRQSTGLSVTEIARRAGLSPSTLTRAYPQPKVDYTLSARTLAKIAAEFPDEVGGRNSKSFPQKLVRGSRADFSRVMLPVFALESFKPSGTARSSPTSLSIVLGQPPVEVWSDIHSEPSVTIPLMISYEEQNRLIGVHLAGDAMEPRLKAGEIAIVDKMKPVPLMADVVVRLLVQRKDVGLIIAQIIKRDSLNMYFSFVSEPGQIIAIPRSEVIEIFPIVTILTNSY